MSFTEYNESENCVNFFNFDYEEILKFNNLIPN